MKIPDIKNVYIDKQKNITYEVMAYRKLDPDEAVRVIRLFLKQLPRRGRPKPNSRVTVLSVID